MFEQFIKNIIPFIPKKQRDLLNEILKSVETKDPFALVINPAAEQVFLMSVNKATDKFTVKEYDFKEVKQNAKNPQL